MAPFRACVVRASPHTRGWTRSYHAGTGADHGFPAHAGMDPPSPRSMRRRAWLPRTRGDGPYRYDPEHSALKASPHTRGWTPHRCGRPRIARGFPAHAGMDRRQGRPDTRPPRLPRTRGDGPPRPHDAAWLVPASPHTRGWTRGGGPGVSAERGFPAHAGMDPWDTSASTTRPRLPRTRGDGPGPIGANLFRPLGPPAAQPSRSTWRVAVAGDVAAPQARRRSFASR